MVKPKIKAEPKCWICHRKLNEVIDAGNKIGYDPIVCEGDPKEIEKNAMFNVDVLGRKVPICAICREIVFEVARNNLVDALNNGTTGDYMDDIVTYKDLENARFEVDLGDRSIIRRHKNSQKDKKPRPTP